MKEGRINLYSDTQTRPSPAMRKAIADAPVGDEQGFLDPTVNALCKRVADLLGKEAATFLPSGTICNEIAICVHCNPGDEIYAHHTAHILNFEGGGPSAIAGAAIRALPGARGMYSAADLHKNIRDGNRYGPRPKLVAVEQTANMGGGSVWPVDQLYEVASVAREHGLALHMDGARLLNAVVSSGIGAADHAAPFDSVWIDLSKGLGCPMGGVLAGSHAFIDEAWRWKQRLGGAMRQAGIIAAAGLYALDHNIDRLADDHTNARSFADIVCQCDGVELPFGTVDSNIVFIDVTETGVSAAAITAALEEQGINVGAMGDSLIRAVTHLDVDAVMVKDAARAFVAIVDALR
ncbi:MAG: threonine aldolase [Gammaproteobacteria bacterium]|jgi:threonine aldolase